MNQDNPMNCVRLYWSRLSQSDIAGAAQLHTDPQREIEIRKKYKERVGDETFRQTHASLFNDGNSFIAELVIGKWHALVSEAHLGFLMLFIEQDGKFLIDNTSSERRSQQADDLITLVNAYGDGKLSLR